MTVSLGLFSYGGSLFFIKLSGFTSTGQFLGFRGESAFGGCVHKSSLFFMF